MPDSRGPGIQEDASMTFVALQQDYPTRLWHDPFVTPPRTVRPEEMPVPHGPVDEPPKVSTRRTEAARQLAAQLNSHNGLGDPEHRLTLASEAHDIRRARAEPAVAAATITSHESRTCVVCLEEYQDADTVSTSSCDHHFHTMCIDSWGAHRLNEGFPFIDCPCVDKNV